MADLGEKVKVCQKSQQSVLLQEKTNHRLLAIISEKLPKGGAQAK